MKLCFASSCYIISFVICFKNTLYFNILLILYLNSRFKVVLKTRCQANAYYSQTNLFAQVTHQIYMGCVQYLLNSALFRVSFSPVQIIKKPKKKTVFSHFYQTNVSLAPCTHSDMTQKHMKMVSKRERLILSPFYVLWMILHTELVPLVLMGKLTTKSLSVCVCVCEWNNHW